MNTSTFVKSTSISEDKVQNTVNILYTLPTQKKCNRSIWRQKPQFTVTRKAEKEGMTGLNYLIVQDLVLSSTCSLEPTARESNFCS